MEEDLCQIIDINSNSCADESFQTLSRQQKVVCKLLIYVNSKMNLFFKKFLQK